MLQALQPVVNMVVVQIVPPKHRTVVVQVLPLQLTEEHAGADIHIADPGGHLSWFNLAGN